MADRSFLGRVTNPKIFDEDSWDLDQQEGEGGPLRIVTSLNFTSLTPTTQPTSAELILTLKNRESIHFG